MAVVEIIGLVGIFVTMVFLGFLLKVVFYRRIRRWLSSVKTNRIRKKNPCYRCPRSRKYVCDGCYVKLRKEWEHEQSQ